MLGVGFKFIINQQTNRFFGPSNSFQITKRDLNEGNDINSNRSPLILRISRGQDIVLGTTHISPAQTETPQSSL